MAGQAAAAGRCHRDRGGRRAHRARAARAPAAGRSGIRLSPASGRRLARFFVVGGVPFGEPLLMWWNFVARSGEKITRAREDWVAGRFGQARGYPGGPLTAPPLPRVPLKPR